MFAIKLHNNFLSIVELSMEQRILKYPELIRCGNLSEATVIVNYLSSLVANVKGGRFELRWKVECHTCQATSFEGYLCANSIDDFGAQLNAHKKQMIEFIFEEYVINFDPEKIEFFQFTELNCLYSDIKVIAHTPTILSLVACSNGNPKLVAGYNLSSYKQRLAS